MVANRQYYSDEPSELTGRITFKNDSFFDFFKFKFTEICVLYVEYMFIRNTHLSGEIIKKTKCVYTEKATLDNLLHKKLLWIFNVCALKKIHKGLVLKSGNHSKSRYISFIELLKDSSYENLRKDERLI